MKKIVIVTSKPEPDYGLLHLLNVLFPNCGVSIVPRRGETFKDYMAGSFQTPLRVTR